MKIFQKNKTNILNFTGIAVIAACLYFLIKSGTDTWQHLKDNPFEIRHTFLSAAIILLIIYYIIESGAWHYILKICGESIPFIKNFKIFYLSALGNFLPLRGTNLVGRIYLTNKAGVANSIGVYALILETVYSLLASFLIAEFYLVSLIYLYFANSHFKGIFLASLALFFAASVFFFTRYVPSMTHRCIEWYYRKKKSQAAILPAASRRFTKKNAFYTLSLFFLARVCLGSSFYLVILSLSHTEAHWFFPALSSQSFAWFSSVIFFFVPKGLGVKEITTLALLANFYPPPVALVATLLFRILTLVPDLGFGLFGLFGTLKAKIK